MSASVITGASRGIGRATALKLAKSGPVLLVATPVSEEKLKALCDEIKAGGGQAAYVIGDVGAMTTAKLVADKATELGWTIRNLVLNAGVSKSGPATATSAPVVADIFQTNFYGAFYFVKEFVPGMVSRGDGCVVALTGEAAVKGYKGMSAYCASKHALLGYLRCLGQEVKDKGVRVACLCPGPVDTDMTAPIVDIFVKKGMTPADAKKKIATANGLSQLFSAEEIARIAEAHCTGQVPVHENGGPISVTG